MPFKLASISDAEFLSDFYVKNAAHLCLWEPLRENGYHSIDSWMARLKMREVEQSAGHALYFISYTSKYNEIIGVCSLTNIVKGPFQACNIGYAISKQYEGSGLMKKLCSHVIEYAFEEVNLNRVMANYIPRNHRSEALLKSLGFRKEGFAKSYLFINGKWEDHVLTSLINPSST